jgi:hypothetical protein
MGQCIYCGRSVGFFRKTHPECEERHERAISLIPGFFPKFLESDLPVERFRDLLQNAAAASYIKPDELKAIITRGISKMINVILEQRLFTARDMERIVEVADALGGIISEDVRPHEFLAKVDVLRDLHERKIPDLINVTGPMPITLRRGESIIWIFNYATCLRPRVLAGASPGPSGVNLNLDTMTYYNLSAFKKASMRQEDFDKEASGDIVVTNRNLYHLTSDTEQKRFPIARIVAIRAYVEGLYISCDPADERTRAFKLNDSWFAGNLLASLVQLARR